MINKFNTKREIDLDYLNQKFLREPKQSHSKLIKLIVNNINFKKKHRLKLVDIGCADGQLLYHFNKLKINNIDIEGSDIHKLLIKKAKRINKSNIKFKVGSALNKKLYTKSSIDILISAGVMPIFSNYKNHLDNLIYWAKPESLIIIMSIFNESNYDTNISYNESSSGNKKIVGGWNVLSKKTVSKYLRNHKKISSFYFKNFYLTKKIKYNKQNPLKLWTLKLQNGKNLCVNGLSVIIDQKYLIIKTKK